VKDPSEATHPRLGSILEFVVPKIHHSALPRVVDRIRSSDCSVKKPLLLGGGSVKWHLDERIHRNGRARRPWEVLLERGIG